MKKRWIAAGLLGLAIAGLYWTNASWRAPKPQGRLTVVAQRGLAQVFDRKRVTAETCTAALIEPPTHGYIDNTIPSMAAAFAAGAEVVELDLSTTADGEFVAFHDLDLGCRTNGQGPPYKQPIAVLKTLDVGHGYTADGGRTFPLRGKGLGLMPTLAEVLEAFPGRRFLIQMKQGPKDMAPRLARYLDAHGADWSRLAFFGPEPRLEALVRAHPGARLWNEKAAARCSMGYLLLGWSGHVPAGCRGGMIVVPVTQGWAVWGWPNRFADRMARHDVEVLLVGGIDKPGPTGFWRVDTARDVAHIPPGLPAQVWTDHVETVGPLLTGR